MAIFEIKTRFGIFEAILWHFKFSRGERVILDWPDLEKFVVDNDDPFWVDCGGAKKVAIYSDDPNKHHRPYLEEKVGVQNRDWMWRHRWTDKKDYSRSHKLEIRFSKQKSKWASVIRLKWSGQ